MKGNISFNASFECNDSDVAQVYSRVCEAVEKCVVEKFDCEKAKTELDIDVDFQQVEEPQQTSEPTDEPQTEEADEAND